MNKGEETRGHSDIVGDDLLFGDSERRKHNSVKVGEVDAGKIAE
jgi:hypothetical protein